MEPEPASTSPGPDRRAKPRKGNGKMGWVQANSQADLDNAFGFAKSGHPRGNRMGPELTTTPPGPEPRAKPR